jgi:SAM-dependent methyltransferase
MRLHLQDHRLVTFDYDAELRRYQQRLRAAIDVGSADRVLDIGCGTGQTTREAARAAASGGALGVDLAAPMLAVARRLAELEGLRNVAFEQADAQIHPFPPEHFDLGISRFGTMFFDDPVAAFTNIARALRPGGRLVQIVWQHSDRQEWAVAIRRALAGERSYPPPARTWNDAFSLADPTTADAVLAAAGFTGTHLADLHEPIYYGPDPAAAYEAVLALRMPQDLLAGLEPAEAERALDRLRAVLAAHDSSDGVWFDSRAWLITARRG